MMEATLLNDKMCKVEWANPLKSVPTSLKNQSVFILNLMKDLLSLETIYEHIILFQFAQAKAPALEYWVPGNNYKLQEQFCQKFVMMVHNNWKQLGSKMRCARSWVKFLRNSPTSSQNRSGSSVNLLKNLLPLETTSEHIKPHALCLDKASSGRTNRY